MEGKKWSLNQFIKTVAEGQQRIVFEEKCKRVFHVSILASPVKELIMA